MSLFTILGYIGLIVSFIYLWLEFKQRQSMWFWSILCSCIYLYIYICKQLYADAGFSCFNICVSFWGLWKWYNRFKRNEKRLGEDPEKKGYIEYRTISKSFWVRVVLVTLGVYLTIYAILHNWTDSPVPHRDAFNTTLNIVGTWLLGYKFIEVWGFWLLANVASVYLYIVRSATDLEVYEHLTTSAPALPDWCATLLAQDMLSTIILYIFYSGASVYGFWKWKHQGIRI